LYYYFSVIIEEQALKHESRVFSRMVKGKLGLILASLIEDSDLA